MKKDILVIWFIGSLLVLGGLFYGYSLNHPQQISNNLMRNFIYKNTGYKKVMLKSRYKISAKLVTFTGTDLKKIRFLVEFEPYLYSDPDIELKLDEDIVIPVKIKENSRFPAPIYLGEAFRLANSDGSNMDITLESSDETVKAGIISGIESPFRISKKNVTLEEKMTIMKLKIMDYKVEKVLVDKCAFQYFAEDPESCVPEISGYVYVWRNKPIGWDILTCIEPYYSSPEVDLQRGNIILTPNQIEKLTDRIIINAPPGVHFRYCITGKGNFSENDFKKLSIFFKWIYLTFDVNIPENLKGRLINRFSENYTVYLNENDIPAEMIEDGAYKAGFKLKLAIGMKNKRTIEVSFHDFVHGLAWHSYEITYYWDGANWFKVGEGRFHAMG